VHFWDKVLEAGFTTTMKVLDTALEVGKEQIRLLVHQLQVMVSGHTVFLLEGVGQLSGESSSAASLVGSGVRALPVVNIKLLLSLYDADV